MRTLATEPEAMLTYLQRQLVKYHKKLLSFNENTCSNLPLARKIRRRQMFLARVIRGLTDSTSHPGQNRR